jgi:hypothetical protein
MGRQAIVREVRSPNACRVTNRTDAPKLGEHLSKPREIEVIFARRRPAVRELDDDSIEGGISQLLPGCHGVMAGVASIEEPRILAADHVVHRVAQLGGVSSRNRVDAIIPEPQTIAWKNGVNAHSGVGERRPEMIELPHRGRSGDQGQRREVPLEHVPGRTDLQVGHEEVIEMAVCHEDAPKPRERDLLMSARGDEIRPAVNQQIVVHE